MVPLLTVIAGAVGMVGGWIVTSTLLRVASSVYWNAVVQGLYIQDVWMGLIKPFFLGFTIVSIGCHVGMRTSGGTQGVGRATTNAVVASSVAVIAVDYLVTQVLIVLMYLMAQNIRPRTAARGGAWPSAGRSSCSTASTSFDEKVILRDVSFTLQTGHTKVFLGASGAGKSTILRLILGLLKPDAGQIFVNGEQVDDMGEDD